MLDKGETLDRLKKYSDGEKISLSIRDVQCKKIRKMKNIEKIKNVIFRNKWYRWKFIQESQNESEEDEYDIARYVIKP